MKIIIILIFSVFYYCEIFCQINDSLISPNNQSSEVQKVVVKDTEAEYPGGEKKWKDYLKTNLNGDVPVKNGAPLGTYMVIVRFIVFPDGNLSEVSAETNFGFGMEEEAIRVIKLSEKWKPAYKNGKPSYEFKRQPLTFVVSKK